jgi:hypothetical protein
MARNFIQSKFSPKNVSKYVGDPSNIFARSSWERKVMVFFDTNPDILKWSSEEIVIPYMDGASGKVRRYFPDFAIVVKTKTGSVERILVEVKPFAQTQPPKKPSKMTKRYITETTTYITNQSKWKAANEWIKTHNFDKFMILTENEIFGK